MDKYNRNRMYRVASILSFLYNDNRENFDRPVGRTIDELSYILDVNKDIVREDIYNIVKYPKKRAAVMVLDSETDCYEDEFNKLVEEFYDLTSRSNDGSSSLELKKKLMSGRYDSLKLYIQARNYSSDEETLVITRVEYNILKDFLSKTGYPLDDYENTFFIKNNYNMTDKEIELMDDISYAIDDGDNIEFEYKGRDGVNYRSVIIKPSSIEHNTDTGFIYVLSSSGDRFRFDRIKYGSFKSINSAKNLDNEPEYKKEDKLTHIRIKIRKYERNDIYPKIIRDLSRKNLKKGYIPEDHVKDHGDYYIYEDEVTDMGALKSWIYRYGSSMVVLEPKELRDRIIESYKERSL